MALIVGFRLGMTTDSASLQSRYSEESCCSQNSRSSASLANFGTDFRWIFHSDTAPYDAHRSRKLVRQAELGFR